MRYNGRSLAMPALSVEYFGVTSERSGDVAVCVSTRRVAGFRLNAEAREDKAILSGNNNNKAAVQSNRAPCSAAIRIFYREGSADMQDEFRAEVEISGNWRGIWGACKNVPSGHGAAWRFFSPCCV